MTPRLSIVVAVHGFAEGFEATAEWSMRLFRSEEATEGMAAFREKRKPSWAPAGEAS